jgi:1-deoxy-D-xylulose-5-phosphate synthase
MVVATPSDESELRLLLSTCYQYPGPAAVRYPRGAGAGAVPQTDLSAVDVGRGLVRRQGKSIAVLVFGTLLPAALKAAEALNLTVADMRFVKPLDVALVLELAATHVGLVTLEDGSIMGGAGSAVSEALAYSAVVCPLLQLGLPDRFIDHGEQGALLASVGLDAAGIEGSIRARFGVQ